MAQAWHKRAPVRRTESIEVWKASKYRGLEAVSAATWRRVAPFASYRHISRSREPDAGPHAAFLRLRKLYRARSDTHLTAMDVFASEYGLLGLFHQRYSAPILPESSKVYISPEAILKNGRLRRVDPATEGLELVAKTVNDHRPPGLPRFTQEYYGSVAMPEEVRFATLDAYRYPDDPSGHPPRPQDLKGWQEVRTGYDALFVFDPSRRAKSSVLVRKESPFAWHTVMDDFPAPPYPEELLPSLAWVLNDRLADVSPKVVLGEHGRLAWDWHCNTLLQAMYLMLLLDLSGGSHLKECESHDCQTYFRLGPQGGTKYCSKEHADRASTRLGRGQLP